MRKVIAMETKLLAVFTAGMNPNVSELCARLGISRQTYYKYQRRYASEGPAGLMERSRRPRHSPGRISPDLEDEIVRLRKTLAVDNGAQSIAYHLARSGWRVPSVASIHRALRRRGLVIDQPDKRPHSSFRRFEWPRPNDAWQIDATRWLLADGQESWIMDLLDDHSRLVVAARVCEGPTVEAAWTAFGQGAAGYGLPAHVMSDNGICFTGRFTSGGENRFEAGLRVLGISHILSAPAHPQTCGKLERFHQTLKRWLRTQPPVVDTRALQTQIDWWVNYYNTSRPHRALSGATPLERWGASSPAGPGTTLALPTQVALLRVSKAGTFDWGSYRIGAGTQWAGHQLLVIGIGDQLTLHGPEGPIRELTLDPARRYQPTGRAPGRPPRPKQVGPCH